MKIVIVTRHQGLVDWLKDRGMDYPVIAHANPESIRDAIVIGILPPRLACHATAIIDIGLNITQEMRGRELTKEDMDSMELSVKAYSTTEVEWGTPIPLGPHAITVINDLVSQLKK